MNFHPHAMKLKKDYGELNNKTIFAICDVCGVIYA